jgi:enoyl-CoA hydratase
VTSPDRVYEEALARARAFADGPSLAYRAAKVALLAAGDRRQEDGLEVEREMFRELFATQDQKEGMRAFLDKRDPRFVGR